MKYKYFIKSHVSRLAHCLNEFNCSVSSAGKYVVICVYSVINLTCDLNCIRY